MPATETVSSTRHFARADNGEPVLSPAPLPCPFCGCDRVEVHSRPPGVDAHGDDVPGSAQVECSGYGCNATGPLAETELEAALAWNHRRPARA